MALKLRALMLEAFFLSFMVSGFVVVVVVAYCALCFVDKWPTGEPSVKRRRQRGQEQQLRSLVCNRCGADEVRASPNANGALARGRSRSGPPVPLSVAGPSRPYTVAPTQPTWQSARIPWHDTRPLTCPTLVLTAIKAVSLCANTVANKEEQTTIEVSACGRSKAWLGAGIRQ
jgi:hypothetical protein